MISLPFLLQQNQKQKGDVAIAFFLAAKPK
jgi:hypothetical protein